MATGDTGASPSSDPHQRVNRRGVRPKVVDASGRVGPAPKCPVKLGPAGRRWWKWAWGTAEAALWTTGDLYLCAHRAQLEDSLASLGDVELSPSNVREISVARATLSKACEAADASLALSLAGRGRQRVQLEGEPAAFPTTGRRKSEPAPKAVKRPRRVKDPADAHAGFSKLYVVPGGGEDAPAG